eukprot:Clim_evm15s66 gene=Clim_evmTU15s66
MTPGAVSVDDSADPGTRIGSQKRTSNMEHQEAARKKLKVTTPSAKASIKSDITDDINVHPSAEAIGRVRKRTDYLSWADYFMGVAFLSAMRSKDPSTQVGACIVTPEHRIVGIGYNGMPNGCDDDNLPWARESSSDNVLETKYPYVCHAEMNAILNKNAAEVKGCHMYVAMFPCNECAKLIIQSGITKIFYLSDKYHQVPAFRASRHLMDLAGVSYQQYVPSRETITIDFTKAGGHPASETSS